MTIDVFNTTARYKKANKKSIFVIGNNISRVFILDILLNKIFAFLVSYNSFALICLFANVTSLILTTYCVKNFASFEIPTLNPTEL